MRKILSVLLLFTSLITFGQTYPDPTGYVNDYAGVINGNVQNGLENQLSNYEDSTSIEITVVTITSLDGTDVKDYAQGLFEDWGIGKKETDAGLLILIAVNDREWRFHTGYGLEEYLTDGTCRRIGDNNLTPNFKNGDYGKGVEEAVDAVIVELGYDSWELREEYKAEKKRKQDEKSARIGYWFLNLLLGLLGFGFIVLIIYLGHRRKEKIKMIALECDKTKAEIRKLTVTINLDKQRLERESLINTSKLLSALSDVTYDSSIMDLPSNSDNLRSLISSYDQYKNKYDQWLKLQKLNKRISNSYSNLLSKIVRTSTQPDFLNKENFIKYLNSIKDTVDIKTVRVSNRVVTKTGKFDMDSLKKYKKYLRSSLQSYDELFEMNKKIITKYEGIDYRRERTNKFKGVNKNHLLRMLDNIENGFTCESINSESLGKSEAYLKIKLSDFDRVSEINRGVISLRNHKASLHKELVKGYLSLNRGYKRLKNNYPDILAKYLKDFRFEKKYYEERYMNNIDRMVDLSYAAILKLDFQHADVLRRNCGDLKTAFFDNIKRLDDLEKRISNSKKTIDKYDDELSAKNGSIYNKAYRKVKDSDVESSTVRKWNDIQDKVHTFQKTTKHFSDYILVAKNAEKLYKELVEIKKRAERDIEEAEEARRRKKRREEEERRRKKRREEEEARRRRRRASSSSSGSFGGFGGGGSFGGFGGGSSGGGGASGRW